MKPNIVYLLFFLLFSFQLSFSQEICDNALDDDGDGLIDLNDPDCQVCGKTFPASDILSNLSFEDYSRCPDSEDEVYKALPWEKGSSPTSDFFHSCDFLPLPFWPKWPTPIPDGEGFVGFFVQELTDPYGEYIATCTNKPFLAGNTYTITFYIGFGLTAPWSLGTQTFRRGDSAVNIAIFGTGDCSIIPFGGINDPRPGCPTDYPGFVKLGSVFVRGSKEWVKTEITFTPSQNINGVVIGGDCIAVNTNHPLDRYYYYLDAMEVTGIGDEVIVWETKETCHSILHGEDTFAAYQWYKDGIAILGATDSTLIATQNGTYLLHTLDNLGNCYLSDTIHLFDAGIQFPLISGPDYRCVGDSASISVNGNFTSWMWDTPNGPVASSRILSPDSGWYKLSVTDAKGCQATDSLYFQLAARPAPSITLADVACFGDSTGSILVSPSGGGSLLYRLNQDSLQSIGNFLSLGVSTNSIYVVNDLGCDTLISGIEIKQPEPLTSTPNITPISCFGKKDGGIEVTVTGGTPAYDYQWDVVLSKDSSISNLGSGSYQLIITDQQGCRDTVSVVLDEPGALILAVDSIVPAFCDLPNGKVWVSATGGIGDQMIRWWLGDSLLAREGTAQPAISAGDYQVIIVDQHACTDTLSLTILGDPSPMAAFEVQPDYVQMITLEGATFSFVSQSENTQSYAWDFGDGLMSNNASPVHTYANAGIYRVILTVNNSSNACPDTFSATIEALPWPPEKIYFPNAFSPNDDGKNDRWMVKGEAVHSFEARIYNRWGKLVATLNSLADSWDGTYKGIAQPEGVYVFHVRAMTFEGRLIERGGTITLIW